MSYLNKNILVFVIVLICIKCTYSWNFNLKFSDLNFINPYCRLKECCNEFSIPADVEKLRKTLKERVYGQHLVEIAVDAVAAHWNLRNKPQKALTLSFHGWPGSGKNYVSKFIADSLFKEGTKSKHVHHFIGRIHFPLNEHAETYKNQLYQWLKENVTNCARQLFIFDEVDKMPPGVLNGIKPLIDYRDNVDGADYTQAIFIFLSNTGAGLINEHYIDMYKKGHFRVNLKLSDFEALISRGSFNEEGGFHHSDTIKANLIDHYIPFLPMEEKHVIECIRDQFRQREVPYPQKKHIDEVMEFLEWGPEPSKLFSKTGCKRISSKVAVLAEKYYKHLRKEL